MKALLLKSKQTLSLENVELPALKSDEMLIKVAACGVCGTDIHLYNGEEGAGSSTLPLIMGHEFSGTVVELGSNISKFKAGDRVTVDPNVYCGQCFQCQRGNGHFCLNAEAYGVSMFGGFAEYCIVTEKAAYKIPDNLSLMHAALVEPIACCLHGIDRANIKVGSNVAIIGMGSIGQLMLQLVKNAGAAIIIAIEPQAAKREKALQLGATIAIDPSTQDVNQVTSELGIASIDSVIECVGRANTMETAIEIASRGATVVLFGLTAPNTEIRVKPLEQVFRKELTITSSFVNPLVTDRVIDLLASGRIDAEAVITDMIPLDESIKIFTDAEYRTHGKILVVPN